MPRAHNPKAYRVHDHDPNRDGRVVERLQIDRARLGKDERNRGESDPDARDECDRARERAEVERPAPEAVAVDETEGDGYSLVRDEPQ